MMYSTTFFGVFLLSLVTAAPQCGPPSNAHNPQSDEPGPDLVLHDGTYVNAYADYHITDWAEGEVTEYPIQNSCNSTETTLLRRALYEAELLAAHARDHV